MTDSVSDPNGTAAAQLKDIVTNYGPRALDDPAFLARILPDLLSDMPRERRIVEAAAAAGVADRLSTRIGHGTPVHSAIVDVAHILSDQAALTISAAEWVVTAYAKALGHEPSGAPAPPAAPPVPTAPPTVTDYATPPPPPPMPPPPMTAPSAGQPVPSLPPRNTGPVYPSAPPPLPYQVSAPPPVRPKGPKVGRLLLFIGLPVLLVMFGICGFVVLRFAFFNNACHIGTWELTSSTQNWPEGTVRYLGSGKLTVVYNDDGTGSMINDRVGYDLGFGSSYTNDGTLTYRYTVDGDEVSYSSVKGSVTSVLSVPGQPDETSTAPDGQLTKDTMSCSGDRLVLTGNGSARNDDGTESSFTYRQEFARA